MKYIGHSDSILLDITKTESMKSYNWPKLSYTEGGTPNAQCLLVSLFCFARQNKLTNSHWGLGVPPPVYFVEKLRYIPIFFSGKSVGTLTTQHKYPPFVTTLIPKFPLLKRPMMTNIFGTGFGVMWLKM